MWRPPDAENKVPSKPAGTPNLQSPPSPQARYPRSAGSHPPSYPHPSPGISAAFPGILSPSSLPPHPQIHHAPRCHLAMPIHQRREPRIEFHDLLLQTTREVKSPEVHAPSVPKTICLPHSTKPHPRPRNVHCVANWVIDRGCTGGAIGTFITIRTSRFGTSNKKVVQ